MIAAKKLIHITQFLLYAKLPSDCRQSVFLPVYTESNTISGATDTRVTVPEGFLLTMRVYLMVYDLPTGRLLKPVLYLPFNYQSMTFTLPGGSPSSF